MKFRNIKHLSFSFMELLIVMVVVFILLTTSVPRLSFVNKFLVQNELDKLFTIFSFLQQRAIASNCDQEIVFNIKRGTYSYGIKNIFNGRSVCKLPKTVMFGFLQNTRGPPSSPNKKITAAITFKKINKEKFYAIFYANGRIQPGTVYFVDRSQNFMMALTSPISQVSFIRKYKYDKGRWVCLK